MLVFQMSVPISGRSTSIWLDLSISQRLFFYRAIKLENPYVGVAWSRKVQVFSVLHKSCLFSNLKVKLYRKINPTWIYCALFFNGWCSRLFRHLVLSSFIIYYFLINSVWYKRRGSQCFFPSSNSTSVTKMHPPGAISKGDLWRDRFEWTTISRNVIARK